jgi:hypothetical protein
MVHKVIADQERAHPRYSLLDEPFTVQLTGLGSIDCTVHCTLYSLLGESLQGTGDKMKAYTMWKTKCGHTGFTQYLQYDQVMVCNPQRKHATYRVHLRQRTLFTKKFFLNGIVQLCL